MVKMVFTTPLISPVRNLRNLQFKIQMHNNPVTLVMIRLLLLLTLLPATVFSQIKIVSPTPRAVFQREISGQREINISGTFDVPIDKIEVRAVPVIGGQGIETAWKDLQLTPKGGVFSGNITLYGGWYTVEVRATRGGNVVGRDVLERLGVGEVFIIAGQSNAQGLHSDPGPGAEDDRVVYVSNYVNDNIDLLTDPPRAQFSKLADNTNFMGPRGQTPWCWGILGDLLVKRLNVPVLFINTAWEGTAVENWQKSADNLPTFNYYSGGTYIYPPGMPYANLKVAVKTYGSQYGMRAVLWMQGEADALFQTTAQDYKIRLQRVINKLGEHASKRITWVIARTSRTTQTSRPFVPYFSASVIGAQNAVIETPFNATYPGPETDNIYPNRGDGTHFVGDALSPDYRKQTLEALTLLANAWNQSLDNNFFATVTPAAPAALPALAATCVTENNAVSISLPEGYTSYVWNNGQTGRTITVTKAGTYFATVKDQGGNSILTSTVVLSNDAKPTPPTILPQGEQQACANEGIVFRTIGRDIYSWYKDAANTALVTGDSVNVKESGTYTVRAQNIFGCVSDLSQGSKLEVRPQIPKPVIESSGPFSITATIAQDMGEKYSWRRPGIETDTIADIIKILKTGTYTAKAQVTYALGANLLTCYSDTASKNFITIETNDLVFYPNPSTLDFIYVESRDDIRDAEITVYDMFGRVLATETIPLLNSRVPFRIKNLASGKYIVRIKGSEQTVTKQIVVR